MNCENVIARFTDGIPMFDWDADFLRCEDEAIVDFVMVFHGRDARYGLYGCIGDEVKGRYASTLFPFWSCLVGSAMS